MKTLRLTLDPHALSSESSAAVLKTAAAILRRGGLVSFPTETVYGLGANALDGAAVASIFAAKQRPAWDPLIVHVSHLEMLFPLLAGRAAESSLTGSARALISAFWPGALTLLLPKADCVPSIVTAGRPLAGFRMPAHPIARALISQAGVPVAAPSANRFGGISPTLAAHVLEDLDGRIDAVIDGGECVYGLESTVVDASREPVVVYRPGIISLAQIQAVCGSAVLWAEAAGTEAPRQARPESMASPGLSLRHYAPRAHLIPISCTAGQQAAALIQAVEQSSLDKQAIGIMLPGNFLPGEPPATWNETHTYSWGSWTDEATLAHDLYAGLHQLDAAGVEVIFCPLPSAHGLGTAIRDRILKASRTA